MTKDDRDTLEVMKAELNFVKKGGYGRSVRTPEQSTSIFQDSPSCLNFCDPEKTHSCGDCLLINFVPQDARTQAVPCHHIPLDLKGTTIDELEWQENQGKTEETLENWLRSTIRQLEGHKTVGKGGVH